MHYCDKKYGAGSSACITDEPPPKEEECKKFFSHEDTPNARSLGKEIKIQDESGKDISFCYPSKNPENETFGWCRTYGNYYDVGNYEKEKKGWGFCSQDCYLDKEGSNQGVLRINPGADILPENLCDKYLGELLNRNDGVEVKPSILCVARVEKWEETTWVKTDKGYTEKKSIGPATRYGSDSYVASPGTCEGDGGGPAYVYDGDRFVVTGVASGGMGDLGECGGINNPTQYVRVKAHVKWILRNLGEEKRRLCWDKKFSRVVSRAMRKIGKNKNSVGSEELGRHFIG